MTVPLTPPAFGATVLRSRAEIDSAAASLDAAGWSWPRRGRIGTRLRCETARLGFGDFPLYRDRTKSWDVWRAVTHCLRTLPAREDVYDVGAWQSEVLWALHRAGFTGLAGCDTDSRVARMPGRRSIRYSVADFFAVDLAPSSLSGITCLSVMEHGMDAQAFLERAARAVRPGGRVIITIDYWPEPIDTGGLEAFGRPWRIFSRPEVEALVRSGARLGLDPDGPVDLEAGDAPIEWNGRAYTFLWLAFVRTSISPR